MPCLIAMVIKKSSIQCFRIPGTTKLTFNNFLLFFIIFSTKWTWQTLKSLVKSLSIHYTYGYCNKYIKIKMYATNAWSKKKIGTITSILFFGNIHILIMKNCSPYLPVNNTTIYLKRLINYQHLQYLFVIRVILSRKLYECVCSPTELPSPGRISDSPAPAAPAHSHVIFMYQPSD